MERLDFLHITDVHPSWNDFLNNPIRVKLAGIQKQIFTLLSNNSEFLTPHPSKVLRFLSMPANDIKVIILGQDPYPQPNIATGRAFEVNGLYSWKTPFRNPSLQNIVRAIYLAYSGNILKYSEIRARMNSSFKMLEPSDIFNHWENQGVLLLNTAFTCKVNDSNSHAEIWKDFTRELLAYINMKSPNAYWFLWGNNAKNAVDDLKIKNTIFSYHPSRCNLREQDFLFGKRNCFNETKHIIDWAEYIEIPNLFNVV